MNDENTPHLTPQAGGSPDPQSGQPRRAPNGQPHAANVIREQIHQIYSQDQPAPAETEQNNPYNRTHQENFDWREYHSAWQQYYQDYYSRYYQQAQPNPSEPTSANTNQVKSLKNDVINSVKDRAKAFRRSHHFLPIISAIAVGGVFLFLQFNSILIAQVQAYVSPGALEGQSVVVTDPTASLTVGPEPRIIIPKINVDIPVNYGITALDDATVQVALRDAAVHYKLPGANSLPGQYGNTAILGHSSNDAFASGRYKFAFVLADKLEPGDTFYLHYEGTRYTYSVTEKKVISPDQVSTLQIGYDKPMVTLITCTPAGTAINRLLVFAEQISPDPTAATAPDKTSQPESGEESIPGNAPTLFERIWGIFF